MDATDALDIAAISTWIESLAIGCRPPIRVERIGHGLSNLTFMLADSAGGRWVLRRPPLGHLLGSAHDVVREARILTALRGTGVPVPHVYGVCEDEKVSDAPLVLLEFVEGAVVESSDVATALEHLQPAIGMSLVRTLARIHAVDLVSTGLITLASHSPFAIRQLNRWTTQWERSKSRDRPELDELAIRLRDAIPRQHELTLVHGDFHLRNVILSASGDVGAALDWELSTLGDPLADLGTLLAYWRMPNEPRTGDLLGPTGNAFPSREELISDYAAASGRDVTTVPFWHTLALWRIAIIAEGVRLRARQEHRNRNTAATHPSDQQIDEIVTAATAVAAAAGI